MRKPVWWLVAVLILAAAAVLIYSWRANRHAPRAVVPVTVPKAPVAAAPAVANPIPPSVGAPEQPLPTLGDSDMPLQQGLGALIGQSDADHWLKPDMLVRHIVVTVDNLSRKRTAVELRPVKPVPGQFVAKGDDQHSTLDPANYQRYSPYVQALQRVDVKQLAALYFHFYPLFQQAYQNLGYPNGYFNDRLVETIDNLLQTPDVKGDIALVRPNVMYQYADPMLENLSAGQKVLLRMGPQNEAIVKDKLKELRAALADRSRAGGNSRERSGSEGG
ncbi:MAG TPA: DUF3014 domain-containing protein [Steroidobacteraceae bacterium]|nr:DUF3014 domain-containing protein [Steroidobacteraceae bacterium]